MTLRAAMDRDVRTLGDAELNEARVVVGGHKLRLRRRWLGGRTWGVRLFARLDGIGAMLAPYTARVQAILDEESRRRGEWRDALEQRRVSRLSPAGPNQ